jgi:hypothetical protein
LERGGAIQELAEHAKATTVKISFFSLFFLFSSFFFYFFKKIDNTTHNTQRREGVALSSLVFFVFEITIAKGQ